jgi:hypothetical protein
MRKAIMKKNKTSDIGEKFVKGSEVFIQTKPIGRGKMKHIASNNEKLITGIAVTPSEFDFVDAAEFTVSVMRTSYSFKNIVVKAKTRKEAESLAIDEAGSYEFSESDAEYEAKGVVEN